MVERRYELHHREGADQASLLGRPILRSIGTNHRCAHGHPPDPSAACLNVSQELIDSLNFLLRRRLAPLIAH